MRHDGVVVIRALLIWLVIYVSLFAFLGFVFFVLRSSGSRPWSDRALLRATSLGAFVGATVLWVLFVIVD